VVFAREITDGLTGLVKKLDAETAKNSDCSMGCFVVFLSDDEGLEQKLKALAKKEGLKKTVLTIDNPAGPRGYNVSKEAEVTVLLYKSKTVKVNHAYKKGELKEKDVNQIVSEVSKILPK
jgi:hypothetical protein